MTMASPARPPHPPPPSPASVGLGSGPASVTSGYSSMISELMKRGSGASSTIFGGSPATDTTIVTRPAGLLEANGGVSTDTADTPPDQRVTAHTSGGAPKKTPLTGPEAQGQRVKTVSPPARQTPGTAFSTNKI